MRGGGGSIYFNHYTSETLHLWRGHFRQFQFQLICKGENQQKMGLSRHNRKILHLRLLNSWFKFHNRYKKTSTSQCGTGSWVLLYVSTHWVRGKSKKEQLLSVVWRYVKQILKRFQTLSISFTFDKTNINYKKVSWSGRNSFFLARHAYRLKEWANPSSDCQADTKQRYPVLGLR